MPGGKPTFAPGYVKPGFYVQQQDISTPNVPAGTRIPAPIGQGIKVLDRQEAIIKGVKNGEDGPLTNNKVIDIVSLVDANSITYRKDIDFALKRISPTVTNIDWALKATISGTVDLTGLTYPGDVEGLTLRLVVDGGVPNPVDQAITFSGIADAADLVDFINAWHVSLAGVASLGTGNVLKLDANSIEVLEDSANSVLGMQTGQSASVQEPAAGVSYDVTYTSDKTAAEYVPRLLATMEQVIAFHGPRLQATTEFTGSPSAVTVSTLVDGTKNFGAANALRGHYIKITAGPGKGFVRVITDSDATSVTISEDWNAFATPTAASTYIITDVNENSITLGAQIMFDKGAPFVITSQYKEDLFDSSNIKQAVIDLEQDVDGFRPEYLVLMRGINPVSETGIVTFLRDHVTTMSDVLNNKYRAVGIGLAIGSTDFTAIRSLALGSANRRVDIFDASEFPRDFGTGQGVLTLDGAYGAAAVAGEYCNRAFDAGEPISQKGIGVAFDVDRFSNPFLDKEKNEMASAGVTIIDKIPGDIQIRHFLSTDNTTIFAAEGKLRRIADNVSKLLRNSLEKTVIGRRFVISQTGQQDVISLTRATINFLLRALRDNPNQQITKFNNLSVKQNQTEKRQLDIQVDIFLTTDVIWTFALLGFTV